MKTNLLTVLLLSAIGIGGNLANGECKFNEQRPSVYEEYKELMARGKEEKYSLDTLLTTSADTAEAGAWNLGVFSVKSPNFDHLLALKFSHPEPMDFGARNNPRPREYVAVHKVLGDLYVAPKLRALLDQDVAETVLKQDTFHTALFGRWAGGVDAAKSEQRWFGVAMDRLMDPHPLSRDVAPPPVFATWCQAHVTRALQEMIEIRRRVMMAGIFLLDQQVVIDPQAHVHLIDVDAYYFHEGYSATTNLTKEAENLVSRWELATGAVYDPALKASLFAELNAKHPVCVRPLVYEKADWRDYKPVPCSEKQKAEVANEEETQELAISILPALQHSYLNASWQTKLAWFTSAAGAGLIARSALSRSFLIAAVMVPSAANAQEIPGYYSSPEGLDYLLRQKDRNFTNHVIRTNPSVARLIAGLKEKVETEK